MSDFTLYHGNAGLDDLETADDVAPEWTHGTQQTPQWRVPSADPWMLDNGAFNAYKKDERWDYIAWMESIDNVLRGDIPEPDVLVMPDVVTDATATYRRTSRYLRYAKSTGFPLYFAVQNGMEPDTAVSWAAQQGLDGIFVGGTKDWKRAKSDQFVDEAHDHGLKCHIGRPGNVAWAAGIGADSADSTSHVRNQSWERLRQEYQDHVGQVRITEVETV